MFISIPVKNFLSSVQLNGETIDFDVNRIKVTVSTNAKTEIPKNGAAKRKSDVNTSNIIKAKKQKTNDNLMPSTEQNSTDDVDSANAIDACEQIPVRTHMTRARNKMYKEIGTTGVQNVTAKPRGDVEISPSLNWLPVVKIKNLTKMDISKYIHDGAGSVQNAKRKSEVDVSSITIRKKQRISNQNHLPVTKQIPKNKNLNSNVQSQTIAKLTYKLNEVVFAKIRGYPCWPARITSIDGRKYEIKWFNDYRSSKVFQTQLFKFIPYYNNFSEKISSNVQLNTAVSEALISKAYEISEKTNIKCYY